MNETEAHRGADVVPLADRRAPKPHAPIWEIQAFVLEAIARDGVGDVGAAEYALARALDLAEPEGLLFPFLFDPAPELLERHPRVLAAHGSLVAKIRHLVGQAQHASAPAEPEQPPDQLSEAEQRVLRYLPSHLTATEIASELYVSANTVKTHMRHLYAKLGVHRRSEAIERARDLGLLSSRIRRRPTDGASAAPTLRTPAVAFAGIRTAVNGSRGFGDSLLAAGRL